MLLRIILIRTDKVETLARLGSIGNVELNLTPLL
jgi:hypothetical protein